MSFDFDRCLLFSHVFFLHGFYPSNFRGKIRKRSPHNTFKYTTHPNTTSLLIYKPDIPPFFSGTHGPPCRCSRWPPLYLVPVPSPPPRRRVGWLRSPAPWVPIPGPLPAAIHGFHTSNLITVGHRNARDHFPRPNPLAFSGGVPGFSYQ